MLYWALAALGGAVVAGLLGFGGTASAVAGVAQLIFFLLLLVSVVMVAIDLESDP